ncbi:MAG: DUF4345 domain-containing protein [Planctomycetota bacterium]
MQPTISLRFLLFVSGLLATGIGASILFDPAAFHATHGIELGSDANLMSEVRAPGGALMVLGLLMLLGVWVRTFTLAATSIAAAVYLAYGASRLVSLALDGVPAPGLVGATAIELALGAACLFALVHAMRHSSANGRESTTPAEAL